MKSALILAVLFLGLTAVVNCRSHDHEGWSSGDRRPGHGGGHRHPTKKTTTSSPAQTTTTTTTTTTQAIIQDEDEELDALYLEALAEGGHVIVYAGGDLQVPTTTGAVADFQARFPNTTLDIIVDYSKFHDARVDIQLATGKLIPDVVHFQTLHDFPRWKRQGNLLNYKPVGWDQVFDEFKDPDGFYNGISFITFTNRVSQILLPDNNTWPTEANDYLKPEFKGRIAVSYPNDDDAVLYWFKLVVDKYGWEYVEKFMEQEPIVGRGTNSPGEQIIAQNAVASPSVGGRLGSYNPSDVTVSVLPKEDTFMSWPQLGAIMKDAKHPAGAKLYMSWLLSYERQSRGGWSVRRDVPIPEGLKSVFEYEGQMDPTGFLNWMANREEVERFRFQITQFFGDIQGEPTPGHLGLYPEKPPGSK